MSPRRVDKATFRAPGIARRKRLLAAARSLLGHRDLDEISLADVARAARIPKSSAYHYTAISWISTYSSSPCSGKRCWRTCAGRFTAPHPGSWSDIVAALVRRGAHYFASHRAARAASHQPENPTGAQAARPAKRQAHRQTLRGADRTPIRAAEAQGPYGDFLPRGGNCRSHVQPVHARAWRYHGAHDGGGHLRRRRLLARALPGNAAAARAMRRRPSQLRNLRFQSTHDYRYSVRSKDV